MRLMSGPASPGKDTADSPQGSLLRGRGDQQVVRNGYTSKKQRPPGVTVSHALGAASRVPFHVPSNLAQGD